jgi:hypothetical protein
MTPGVFMIKRTLLLLAIAGIYIWIRRNQQSAAPVKEAERAAESEWANEGGANPSPTA